MQMEDVITLGRRTLEAALIVGAPVLVITTVISLVINIAQVLTSVQETTVATVPRLATAAIAALLLMPWMLRKLVTFTIHLFSDFRPYMH